MIMYYLLEWLHTQLFSGVLMSRSVKYIFSCYTFALRVKQEVTRKSLLTFNFLDFSAGPLEVMLATTTGVSPRVEPTPPAILRPSEPEASCCSSTVRMWLKSSLLSVKQQKNCWVLYRRICTETIRTCQEVVAQWAHNLKQRWFNVLTLNQCWIHIVSTLCTCW